MGEIVATIRISKVHRFSYYVPVNAPSTLEAQMAAHDRDAAKQIVVREHLYYDSALMEDVDD